MEQEWAKGTEEEPCNLLLCSPAMGAGAGRGLGRVLQGRGSQGWEKGGMGWGCSRVVSVCDRDCVPVTVQRRGDLG